MRVSTSPQVPLPLPPPRFSLRSMMLAVSLCCILLGATWWLSTAAMAMLVFVVMIVGAHLAGAAIGTQLRDGSLHRPLVDRASPLKLDYEYGKESAPPSHLSQRSSLRVTIVMAIILGAIIGMVLGARLMLLLYAERLSLFPFLLTLLTFAILGALGCFVLATFLHVLVVAYWQAVRHK